MPMQYVTSPILFEKISDHCIIQGLCLQVRLCQSIIASIDAVYCAETVHSFTTCSLVLCNVSDTLWKKNCIHSRTFLTGKSLSEYSNIYWSILLQSNVTSSQRNTPPFSPFHPKCQFPCTYTVYTRCMSNLSRNVSVRIQDSKDCIGLFGGILEAGFLVCRVVEVLWWFQESPKDPCANLGIWQSWVHPKVVHIFNSDVQFMSKYI